MIEFKEWVNTNKQQLKNNYILYTKDRAEHGQKIMCDFPEWVLWEYEELFFYSCELCKSHNIDVNDGKCKDCKDGYNRAKQGMIAK